MLLIPQIDIILNVRYAIPGEARPLMYNNELESWFFEVVERGSEPDKRVDAADRPKEIFYLDWKQEEMYRVKNAQTLREVAQRITEGDGLGSLELELLTPSPEGEAVIERLLDEDPTVMPTLIDDYLQYTPAPNEDLLSRLLDETDAFLGSEEEVAPEIELEPSEEVQAEGEEAYEEILRMLESDIADPEELAQAEELLETMKDATPEEMKPLHDLLKLLRETDPERFDEVKETMVERMKDLEAEIEQDAGELAELLMKSKKAAEMKGKE